MEKKAGVEEILDLEQERGTPAVIASAPKKRKTEAVDGTPVADVCDDVAGNILARLPACAAVGCTVLSKRHCRLIRSPEFRSLHLRLAPPLPRPQIAYVATAPIRWRPDHKPVSGYHGFHVAGAAAAAGLRRHDPVHVLAGGRYLGTRYANTCNGVVLISGEEYSAPARCTLWNPAIADDAKEVTIPDSWPDSTYLVLALGYGRSSETYKLLVCRKHRHGRNYKYSAMIYALGGDDVENPKRPPELAVLSARLNDKANFGWLKTLYIDGTIYLLHFHETAVLAFDVDEETVSAIDLPGVHRAELFEMSGRPCVAATDGGNRTLWRLTADHQWERRCVIAVKSGHYYRKGDLRYCPITGVWDCGDVLVMYFKDTLGMLCLYHVATEKMYKADLSGDLTPECWCYQVCWGYRPTLVSPGSIVVDKLNQGKETRRDHTAEIMQLMKPVKEQEKRKGRKATLSAVCFMELLAYIMRKLPDDFQNLVEIPMVDSEYSISFSEHTVNVKAS